MSEYTDKERAITAIADKIREYINESYQVDVVVKASKIEYGGLVTDDSTYSIKL